MKKMALLNRNAKLLLTKPILILFVLGLLSFFSGCAPVSTINIANEEFLQNETYVVFHKSSFSETITITKEDMENIGTMKNISYLDLSECEIEDLSSLTILNNLSRLKTLKLSVDHNKISDIAALVDLSGLNALKLHRCTIDDFSILEDLSNLDFLSLVACKLTDIYSLASLTNLTNLDLSFNDIKDVSALSSLTNLTRLDLSSNDIKDISTLESLTALEFLSIGTNSIENVSPLKNLTSLKTLDISWNKNITNINGLGQLDDLWSINLSGTGVTDYSPLLHLPNLFRIECDCFLATDEREEYFSLFQKLREEADLMEVSFYDPDFDYKWIKIW